MKIGIIGAMEEEAALLRKHMTDVRAIPVHRMTFYEGTLAGHDVVLVVCGVGKVNAAICAQALVDRFDVSHIVFTGVAGSLDASIDICDVVISTDCVHHDMDASGLGYEPGVIPYQDVWCFEADAMLRGVVAQAVREVAPEIAMYDGRIASGDQFVSDAATKERIASVFGALCCEMEGAAVAQVAWMNEVPFVIIRAISDKADDSAEMDYPAFMQLTANRSAAIVVRVMELLEA